MSEVLWINVKTAATLAHVSPRHFRDVWTPEEGEAQVRFRTNGRTGRARRIEVDQADLEDVLEARTRKRAG